VVLKGRKRGNGSRVVVGYPRSCLPGIREGHIGKQNRNQKNVGLPTRARYEKKEKRGLSVDCHAKVGGRSRVHTYLIENGRGQIPQLFAHEGAKKAETSNVRGIRQHIGTGSEELTSLEWKRSVPRLIRGERVVKTLSCGVRIELQGCQRGTKIPLSRGLKNV